MTCGETLAFYAAVILSATGQQRKQQVQEVLREMGLGASSNTLVGTAAAAAKAARSGASPHTIHHL
jgi:ABC-type multidrug transport system ATPase subunit